MAYNLLSCDREQGYLMPPSLKEWLDEGHLAWFTIDAVSQMDLSEFYSTYRNYGYPGSRHTIARLPSCWGRKQLHPTRRCDR